MNTRTKLSKQEQVKLLGLFASMRERINAANLRARMIFRRPDGKTEILNMSEWIDCIRDDLNAIDEIINTSPFEREEKKEALM